MHIPKPLCDASVAKSLPDVMCQRKYYGGLRRQRLRISGPTPGEEGQSTTVLEARYDHLGPAPQDANRAAAPGRGG